MSEFVIVDDFEKFKIAFLKQNAILNLISKNEEKFLYEKHIYDSLAIKLFFDSYKIDSGALLDIGTGGGFPAIPIAIEYPNIKVTALDSIKKKINAIENIKNELGLDNVIPLCGRAENIKYNKFDIIYSRAVASLEVLLKYAVPLLVKGGYFVAYKSKKSEDELSDAQSLLDKLSLKYVDCIDYTLPLDEVYERKLMIFKKS